MGDPSIEFKRVPWAWFKLNMERPFAQTIDSSMGTGTDFPIVIHNVLKLQNYPQRLYTAVSRTTDAFNKLYLYLPQNWSPPPCYDAAHDDDVMGVEAHPDAAPDFEHCDGRNDEDNGEWEAYQAIQLKEEQLRLEAERLAEQSRLPLLDPTERYAKYIEAAKLQIRRHEAVDRAAIDAGNRVALGEYITVEWYKAQLLRQGKQCWHCKMPLRVLTEAGALDKCTVDRINDKYWHGQSNCRLACMRCQRDHSNRREPGAGMEARE